MVPSVAVARSSPSVSSLIGSSVKEVTRDKAGVYKIILKSRPKFKIFYKVDNFLKFLSFFDIFDFI